MRVLVTNDDGIGAPGLAALVSRAVQAGHEVVALAPRGEMSGSGSSMGTLALHEPIQVRPWSIPGLTDVPTYGAEATPSACAILGRLGAVGPEPDLVLSGVNRGFNVGRSALHSGTVGAAMSAGAWGAKGLAVSTAWTEGEALWDDVASVALDLVDWFMNAEALRVLNLNVPNVPRGDLEGLVWANLAPLGAIRSRITGIEQNADGDGFCVLTDHVRTDPAASPTNSDRAMVDKGYATITALGGLAEWVPAGDHLQHTGLLSGCMDTDGVGGAPEPERPSAGGGHSATGSP